MINPKIMCRQHLLGEHVELHMFIGSIIRGYNLDGYVKNNCLEYKAMFTRHEALVKEMKRRGYNHKSPLLNPIRFTYPDYILNSKVDIKQSLKELLRRCDECGC